MKLLIFSAVVFCVSALGEDQCSWGPSHWCSSLSAAKQCGAYQHCKDTVWSTLDLSSTVKDEVCDFCENILTDVKKFVTSDETKNDVIQYLDSACAIIPDQELADKCKDTVKNDIDELWDMVKSELDPQAICAAIGLCSGFEDHTVHELPRVAINKPGLSVVQAVDTAVADPADICADCKKLMDDLRQELNDNNTVAQVEALIKDQLCSQMGVLKDECDNMVTTFVPEILQALYSQMDPEMICASLGLCENGDLLMLVKMRLKKSPLYQALAKKTDVNSDECTFCKLVFEELQTLDRDASVQKEVEDFVNNQLCSKLGSFQEECETTVNTYGQMIFELLANELDPDTRCKALGFCSSGKPVDDAIRAAMPMTKPKPKTKEVKASAGCIMCEAVMTELKSMLTDNATEAEVMADLDKVCGLFPDTIKQECLDFVDTYGPAVVELLVQELDPKEICTMLGLCTSSTVAKSKSKLQSDEMCGICETVVQYLDSVLQDNATEAEIKQELERICNFLPDTIKETCDSLVEQYMDLIIQLVAQELTPEEVCTELGLCTSQALLFKPFINNIPIIPKSAPLVGTNECTYGPEFWCVNEENAKKCNATKHCQEKVWPKN